MKAMKRIALAVLLVALAPPARALTQPEALGVVRTLDERTHNNGDFTGLCYLEQKEKDKSDVVYELVYYRRSEGQRLLMLFTKPKSEAGKGYLRIEKNLWMYDPGTGKWERRTERERIGGTDSRRGDFDESRLAEEYDVRWEADEKLGAYSAHKLVLQAKEGADVAFPTLRLWLDAATGNLLKRQDLALSGRLMRTALYPRWKKVWSESKKGDVWYPEQIYLYDEIEKANSTMVIIKQVDLRSLSPNMFTKAWLEAKSR
jgi:outer membrane lipoprotein-sorting protein